MALLDQETREVGPADKPTVGPGPRALESARAPGLFETPPDLRGAPVRVLDAASAALRVVARPRPLGAERLERFFAGEVE